MLDFWHKQKQHNPQGIVMIAPMADVTDNPFRTMLTHLGKPDVMWNEFVSADGLSHPEGKRKLMPMLHYEDNQQPIVAQIFSGDADNCCRAARICHAQGFDAIDINMGCPARNILKQVSGSELSKKEHRTRVTNIIEKTREGAGDTPVSVKTRLGFNEVDWSWIEFLLEHKLPVLTVHLRTKKEMSKVAAHWELASQLVALRDQVSPETLIVANGDVGSREEAYECCRKYGLDGVMIGRGVFANPWLFAHEQKDRSVQERIEAALLHTRYFIEEYTVDGVLTKNFNLMKKFYKMYIQGFDGARELRTRLMQAGDYDEVEAICRSYLT